MRGRWFSGAAAVAVLLAGLGFTDSAVARSAVPVAPEHRLDATAGGRAAQQDALPDVEVVRVADGAPANVRSLAVAGKPILLWFWAPHCSFCKAEAPKLLDFSARHGSKIQILGLGAQDDFGQAEGFVRETETAGLQMVWDRSGRTWVHYRVTSQPTVIVLDGEGRVVKRFFRQFDEAAILEAAKS